MVTLEQQIQNVLNSDFVRQNPGTKEHIIEALREKARENTQQSLDSCSGYCDRASHQNTPSGARNTFS
ncbi:MAG: hypothetical protein PHH70_04385 [Candidatus Gracilibacteria bacterium]|nr:hypothetical protein [Candidatus Gracilibacteria bacterium]